MTADHWKCRTGCLRSKGVNIWHQQRQIHKEKKNSGEYKRLPIQKLLWSPSWFAVFSFLHSFIIFISGPASLYIIIHWVLYYSAFQYTYFAPPLLLAQLTFLLACNILISNLVFYLPTTFIHSTLYSSPIQTLKTNSLVKGHFTYCCPIIKIPVLSLHL